MLSATYSRLSFVIGDFSVLLFIRNTKSLESFGLEEVRRQVTVATDHKSQQLSFQQQRATPAAAAAHPGETDHKQL